MNNFKKWVIGIALVLLVAVVAVAPTALNKLVIDKQLNLPQFEPVEVHWVNQNWSSQEWEDWYHIPQGSALEAPIPSEVLNCFTKLNILDYRIPFSGQRLKKDNLSKPMDITYFSTHTCLQKAQFI